MAAGAPSARAAFGVEGQNFEAATCVTSTCTYASVRADPGEAYTQAAGHPEDGITTFEFNHRQGTLGGEPEGAVKNIRVDLPPGLAANPEAVPACPIAAFQSNTCSPDTQVGVNELTVFDGIDLTIPGTVYNLQQPAGLPLDFGIHVAVEPLVSVDIYLEGHVSWSTDYHEYFEIRNVPREGEGLGLKVPLSVLKSRLIFNGQAGDGAFLTLPSACSSTTTSSLEVESWEGQLSRTQTHAPAGVEGCGAVPFKPTVTVTPEDAQSDEPDGASTDVHAPQGADAGTPNTSDIRDAQVTLPEGLTLDPSAAHGLQACTAAEIAIGSTAPVSCPAASKVGSVNIETDLPPGSLGGNVYLGSPSGATITGPPYTIYLDAESAYGVSVRLAGQLEPNPLTGRLQVTFDENPQLPFTDLVIKLDGGPRAPLANPLTCNGVQTEGLLAPYTGGPSALTTAPFASTGCPVPLAFSIAQDAHNSTAAAGAHSSYTLALARSDGQQYISSLETLLPAGLVGSIPSVPLCQEPAAAAGTCSPSSEIGTVTISAGAGPEPYAFSGHVFLTGPYGGAPFGLSIPVDAAAGPFDLGSGQCDCVLTRAAINIDPHSGRVIVTSTLPSIVKGVPLRLRSISLTVSRPGFLTNPTSCGVLSSDTKLTSAAATTAVLHSPFEASGCSALAFKPALTASTLASASKRSGAALEVNVTQGPGQANIRSVHVQLPAALPSRLSTLQKACPAATYEANPYACPSASRVGSAAVRTPVLPDRLAGPAYLVSRGGAGFPDLDLLLQGDGVRVILVGNTNIAGGITTSTFPSIPDVPVSAFSLSLPMGPDSVLSAYGSLCAKPLVMPTTLVAQNGAQVKQNTRIALSGCAGSASAVRILSRKIDGHTLILRVRTLAAGRITVSGANLRAVTRRLARAQTSTLRVPLSRAAIRAFAVRRLLRVAVHVRFVPSRKGEPSTSTSTSLTLRS
jgi:hypothetical protein